ncbi:MAG: diguanylate cyclase [Candidatus Izimaplasma sp.]|nr:diguanylate cyclase [Candidatus Izimaplasma bacterium]
MQKQSKSLFIWITIAFALVYVFVIAVLIYNYQDAKGSYYQDKYDEQHFQIESKVNSYAAFADYFFEKIVNDESVLYRYNQAVTGDSVTQDIIRQELYQYYSNDYTLMQTYSFRQFHFHLPDNTSFLRMDQPEIYGDDLSDFRYSVAYVNREQEYISGFEEGRTFSGYRYVFPMTYQDKHIGSVELSVSMTDILSDLNARYQDKDYMMIIERDVVDNKVFDDELDSYMLSFSTDYYIEKTAIANDNFNVLSSELFNQLLGNVSKEKLDLGNYQDKQVSIVYEQSRYDFIFVPLVNMNDEAVGYIITLETAEAFTELRIRYISYFIATTVFVGSNYVLFLFIDKARKKLREISQHDSLTGIYNRRYLDQFLEKEIARSKRSKMPFSLLMFDIDHFKEINDTYGHLKGDAVLENLVKIINNHIRQEDIVARFGGEEFVIILINTEGENALTKAKQLTKLVEKSNIADLTITISIGVTTFDDESTIDTLIHKADTALYYAKEHGRNKAIRYQKEMDDS